MSDFIKVNFIKDNNQMVIQKDGLILSKYSNEGTQGFYVASSRHRWLEGREITSEEYEKLCKELGVEDYEQWTNGVI